MNDNNPAGLRMSEGRSLAARPNFIFGDNGAPMGPHAGGNSGRELIYRPNFVMGGNAPTPAVTVNPTIAERAYNVGNKVGQFATSPVGRGALRVAGTAGGIAEGLQAVDNFQQGDVAGGVNHGLRATASVMASRPTPAALPAMAFLAGNEVGDRVYSNMDDIQKGGVGHVMNKFANLFGAGVDGDKAMENEAKVAQITNPVAPARTLRTGLPQASYSNEGRERSLANISPGETNFAPVRGTRDFSADLAKVPAQLPSDLRDGMVYKSKDANGNTVYSGRNVSGDVSDKMLNGDGTSAGKMRGSIQSAAGAPVFGPNGSYVIDNNAPTGAAKQAAINATLTNPDGSRWTERDNAIMAANLRNGQDPYLGTSRQPQNISSGPTTAVVGDGGGYGLLSREHQDARSAKMERDSDIANLRRKGLSANQAATFVNNQLIQDKANNASLRNAQIGANAQMYGHDVTRQGHELNANVSLRNNELTNATAMAGHNMSMAANRAKLMYDMSKDQRDFAAGRFDKGLEQAAKADEQARNALKFFGKDKDGKPFEDTAKGNAAYELLMRQNPNWSQLPLQDRAKLLSDARVHTDLINNLRDHQSNSWWQAMGIMPKDVQADHLPDLRGAKVTEVGPVEGAATYNAERGGYKINVGGKDFYLGRDQVGEDHLSYLKKNGANIGSLGAK